MPPHLGTLCPNALELGRYGTIGRDGFGVSRAER